MPTPPGGRTPIATGRALAILALGVVAFVALLVAIPEDPLRAARTRVQGVTAAGTRAASASAPASAPATTAGAPATTAQPSAPAIARTLVKKRTIDGRISPKSVVASGTGFVTAQNMMYNHSVTVYDSEGQLVTTVPDAVRLSDFGIDKPGTYKGAPVEAAFTRDGSHMYVSNYAMYGPGFSEGSDDCVPGSKVPASFLYRIDTKSWAIDQVIGVGSTPKFVAISPDDKTVLATNWCSYDLSVVDAATAKEIKRIPMGAYPRGIVFSPDGATAHVAVMGGNQIAKVDMNTFAVTRIGGVGSAPRHLVRSPDGRYLYVTNNGDGTVVKIDTSTDAIVKRVKVGSKPRSMAISSDGTALYNVNYDSSTVSKLDANDLREVQELPTGQHPIGITYDAKTGRIWVANYSGTIEVYDER